MSSVLVLLFMETGFQYRTLKYFNWSYSCGEYNFVYAHHILPISRLQNLLDLNKDSAKKDYSARLFGNLLSKPTL